jgi:hypothetical protein
VLCVLRKALHAEQRHREIAVRLVEAHDEVSGGSHRARDGVGRIPHRDPRTPVHLDPVPPKLIHEVRRPTRIALLREAGDHVRMGRLLATAIHAVQPLPPEVAKELLAVVGRELE